MPKGTLEMDMQSDYADTASIAHRFMDAIATGKQDIVRSCLSSNVRMRALLPSGYGEVNGAQAVTDTILSWFEDAESLEILDGEVTELQGRIHQTYRFREHYGDNTTSVIEQHIYWAVQNGLITSMDLLCSGHLFEEDKGKGKVHHFDAGNLHCASGLPEEFRRRIRSIPVGDELKILTEDPSARQDLPSMARLLGHDVVSVESHSDRVTEITVKRMR